METGRKLNVRKTFRRPLWRPLNIYVSLIDVLCPKHSLRQSFVFIVNFEQVFAFLLKIKQIQNIFCFQRVAMEHP